MAAVEAAEANNMERAVQIEAAHGRELPSNDQRQRYSAQLKPKHAIANPVRGATKRDGKNDEKAASKMEERLSSPLV